MTLDPRAWAIKYLTAASVSPPYFEFTINGINLNMLISRAIQINSQFELETAITELRLSVISVIVLNNLFE
jgi:hypothetical protein